MVRTCANLYFIPGLKGPRDRSTRSSIIRRVTQFWAYLWCTINLLKPQAEDSLHIKRPCCVMSSFCRGTATICVTGASLQPCNPCFCIVRPRPVQSETESGIDGFPNGQSVRRAAEPWGGKDAGDPVPGVANKSKPRLELHVSNWNHIVCAVGVARKAKHQMRDASRQPKTRQQPIIPSWWL